MAIWLTIKQLEIHIGYVYPHATPPPNASNFTPKFAVGARLPHAWIKPFCSSNCLPQDPIDTSYVHEFSAAEIAARRWSTLDLVAPGTFTVITGQRAAWADRFEDLQKALKPWNLQVRLWSAGFDFEFTDRKQHSLFDSEVEFESGGAMLVRPDQHLLGCLGDDTTVQDMISLIQTETGFHMSGDVG